MMICLDIKSIFILLHQNSNYYNCVYTLYITDINFQSYEIDDNVFNRVPCLTVNVSFSPSLKITSTLFYWNVKKY